MIIKQKGSEYGRPANPLFPAESQSKLEELLKERGASVEKSRAIKRYKRLEPIRREAEMRQKEYQKAEKKAKFAEGIISKIPSPLYKIGSAISKIPGDIGRGFHHLYGGGEFGQSGAMNLKPKTAEAKRKPNLEQVSRLRRVKKTAFEAGKEEKEFDMVGETIKGLPKAGYQVGEFLAKIPAYVGAQVGVSLARMPGQIYRGTASLIDKKPRRIAEKKPLNLPWLGDVPSYAYEHTHRVDEIIEGKDIEILGKKIPWQARALFPFFEIPFDVLWMADITKFGAKHLLSPEKFKKTGFDKTFKLLKKTKISEGRMAGKKVTEKELIKRFEHNADMQLRFDKKNVDVADTLIEADLSNKCKTLDEAFKRIKTLLPRETFQREEVFSSLFNWYNSMKMVEKQAGIIPFSKEFYVGSKTLSEMNTVGVYLGKTLKKLKGMKAPNVKDDIMNIYKAMRKYQKTTLKEPNITYSVLGALGIGAGAEEIDNPFKS